MQRLILAFIAGLALSACGLGETAISAGAGAAAAAQQAKDAKTTEAHVKEQLDAAAALEAQRRKAAEADSQ